MSGVSYSTALPKGKPAMLPAMHLAWKRPGLVAVEIGWRWAFWVVAWGAVYLKLGTAGVSQWMQRLEEVPFIVEHHEFVFGFDAATFFRGLPSILTVLVVWAVVSALGRAVLLPRMDARFRPRRATLMTLAIMRVLLWAGLMLVWVMTLAKTWTAMVQEPAGRGEYPSYVPGFAIVLFATLALFLLWCVTSWMFRLAAVLAAAKGLGVVGSLGAAWRTGRLRGKLIEVNLVMGIVKVALVVLAMVFLACPLPFSAVETQAFLICWWCGVGLLWVVASDYFHVVRAAAYVTLWRAHDFSEEIFAQDSQAAS